ncbi:hypothetical protein NKJ23_23510 [Mesorhizobium sp. M0184]|uniref:hypothetical protein n=1 Tax=Mesorhizobium sp. M0184 TaxID=2956906 RepID=UPI0033355E2E
MSLPPVPDAPQRPNQRFEHFYLQMKNISTGNWALSLCNRPITIWMGGRSTRLSVQKASAYLSADCVRPVTPKQKRAKAYRFEEEEGEALAGFTFSFLS